MLNTFLAFSIFFCVLCYMNMDPMKSSFFLIFSLLSSMPLISFSTHIWYSYFICLLFLSGIFVILVYFSSLSKINFVKSKGSLIVLFVTIIFCSPSFLLISNSLNLNNFYYSIYWVQLFFIVCMLLLFMNFCSYFLNFSGALRKV